MDRDFIVRLCYSIYKGNADFNDIIKLLREFCISKGAEVSKVPQLLNYILNSPFLNDCIGIALTHYKKQFNITEVTEDNNILLIF